MSVEDHNLLKSVCAIKGIGIGDYCNNLHYRELERLVREDSQIRQMFLAGVYPRGSKASALQEIIVKEMTFE